MGIRSDIGLFLRMFVMNLRAAMEYRTNFLIQVFGMMLNNAAFAVFWKVLLDRTGNISGYGFGDIMFIWAATSTSFGLALMVAGNAPNIGRIIREGDLDVYLLQPRNALFNILASRSEVSAIGDFLYGYAVIALLPGMDAWRFLLFTAFAVTGASVFAGMFIMTESLTFWMGSSEGISGVMTEFLLSFSLYPEKIFGNSMRWVFYSIIPAGFIAGIPLSIWRNFGLGALGILALAAGIYFALSRAVFKAGLRRYESGNRMGARV